MSEANEAAQGPSTAGPARRLGHHFHIGAESDQQLIDTRMVAFHGDPPGLGGIDTSDSGGSPAFTAGPSHNRLHPQTMLLCVSSRKLVEVLLVALGELAVVAQASFEG